jgi:hypothetical protein
VEHQTFLPNKGEKGIEGVEAQAYQLLIPPSIESKLVCGLNTLIPFADNFKRDAWRVLDNFSDLIHRLAVSRGCSMRSVLRNRNYGNGMDEKEGRVGGGGEPEVSIGVESVGELPEKGGKVT